MGNENSGVKKSRRKLRNFLLEPFFQIGLGVYSILLATIFSGCVLYTIYFNLQEFVDIVLTLTDTENEVKALLSDYLVSTKWWLALIISVFMISNIVVSIIYTHKLVGPSVAFRNHLRHLMNANFSARVVLRKGDAFQDVADDLNRLSDLLARNQGRIPTNHIKESEKSVS